MRGVWHGAAPLPNNRFNSVQIQLFPEFFLRNSTVPLTQSDAATHGGAAPGVGVLRRPFRGSFARGRCGARRRDGGPPHLGIFKKQQQPRFSKPIAGRFPVESPRVVVSGTPYCRPVPRPRREKSDFRPTLTRPPRFPRCIPAWSQYTGSAFQAFSGFRVAPVREDAGRADFAQRMTFRHHFFKKERRCPISTNFSVWQARWRL